MRLVLQEEWKIFTFYTSLQGLRGCEERAAHHRPLGAHVDQKFGQLNWAETRQLEADFDGGGPRVLIIGAGQAGLSVAARLKMLGISSLLIEQGDRVGDNWRKRYRHLTLHDPVWFDHMPYMEFPSSWPVFTPKDKLAQFFEAYVQLLELNVWTGAEVTDAAWDDGAGAWTVVVDREAKGKSRTLHPRHVIQATGKSGIKYQPDIKGMESFRGHRLCHSSEFLGARERGSGKRAVVVGSCNSGHDIAQDYFEQGYHVTMVQRSSTHVLSSKTSIDTLLKDLYFEGGPPVEDADLLQHSLPTGLLKAKHVEIAKVQREDDECLLAALEKVGFKTDQGASGAGLVLNFFQRGGGSYIDVGASQLIADGHIQIKQGREVVEMLPHGIAFDDGSTLDADEIVLATGFLSMREQTRRIFGDEVADRSHEVWGFNQEGEIRAMWQKSGHPGFWYHGGALSTCRYFSKLLALQIKGLEEGLYDYDDI